ncbi:hypothetical protein [uncultured Draconibacterium sp.]|uniref:hypothetical protein n=1 Tax=uncultured Draconibacterium sp. TaxID=1573823 RepID=UPI0025DAB442|nr:hypothetical protein [uncultured Draconibacterium sp.]
MNWLYKLRLWQKILIIIIVTFLPLAFLKSKLEFSPENFMNEWLKFFLFSLGWVLIANEFLKRKTAFDKDKETSELVNNLIIEPCNSLISSIKSEDSDKISQTWSFISYVLSNE